MLRGIAEDSGLAATFERECVEEIQSHWEVDTCVRMYDKSSFTPRGYQKVINIMSYKWDDTEAKLVEWTLKYGSKAPRFVYTSRQ